MPAIISFFSAPVSIKSFQSLSTPGTSWTPRILATLSSSFLKSSRDTSLTPPPDLFVADEPIPLESGKSGGGVIFSQAFLLRAPEQPPAFQRRLVVSLDLL